MKRKKKSYKKSYKRKPKKVFYQSGIFKTTIVVVFILLVSGYFLLFFDFFWVEKIEISGNERIETGELKKFIEEDVSNKVFFIETRNIFFFNPHKTARKLMNQFPALSGLRIRKNYPDKIILKVFEKKAIGTICTERCFLIDSMGIIFEEVEEKKALNIKTEKDDYFVGQRALSLKEVESITYIQNRLRDTIDIYQFHVDDFSLNVKTKERWEIRFNLNKDVSLQVTKLLSVLNEKILLDKRNDLEYIELKFEKVYFKYR